MWPMTSSTDVRIFAISETALIFCTAVIQVAYVIRVFPFGPLGRGRIGLRCIYTFIGFVMFAQAVFAT